MFLLAISAVALHVVDDSFVQPEPGATAGDHLVSGLVPLALLALAAWGYPRLSGFWRGALALALAPLALAAGVVAFHYTRNGGPSGDDFTGLLCIPAGLALIGLGATTLWQTRQGGRWRYPRRALIGAAGAVAAFLVVIVGYSYVTVHAATAYVPENRLGVATEDVTFTTADGLKLEGWYVPSRNGAAVISFPGRRGPQRHARMLARHGYGVLLFDRRGEGRSEGEPNSWGWDGDRDVKAAIDWLQRRSDVDPDRIGGIGLSVGGEMLIETAAETDELKAVVSDGAGARSYAEDMVRAKATVADQTLGRLISGTKTAAVALFSNTAPPDNLEDLAAKVAPTPLMLIAAPNSPNGETLNRDYYRAASRPKTLWEIPEAGHTGGIEARSEEYERRVVGFFDEALKP